MAQLGDALGNKANIGGGASDEYYAWKLIADKMAVQNDDRYNDSAKAVLGAVSQKEGIKFAILAKLNTVDYAESSANFAQLQAFTGGAKTKLAMAEALAEMVFEKERDELIMANLVGPSAYYRGVMAEPSKSAAAGGIASYLAGIAAATTAFLGK
jgi:hypothetical protein